MLHITSGQSVDIQSTRLPGEVIYWMDVLHEGPAPAALSLAEMSAVRARFIAEAGWGPFDEVQNGFLDRDARLARFAEHEEAILWFEHDLYDQLQLLQILDWFSVHDRSNTRLTLICIGSFPGIGRFTGLGQLNGTQLLSLLDQRRDISRIDLKLAAEGWFAYCSPDPSDIETLLKRNIVALPYLKGALTRHLEQFPSTANGLSRSEQQIVDLVASGLNRFPDLFPADQDQEERVFAGDLVIWSYIHRLANAKTPLVQIAADNSVHLTDAGHAVRQGQEDHVRLNGVDRWLGGVHLEGDDAEWRWDREGKRLAKKGGRRAHRG
ncbi:MAG: hypothetical protein ACRD96_03460 [Bryobacteraceae bacterium]